MCHYSNTNANILTRVISFGDFADVFFCFNTFFWGETALLSYSFPSNRLNPMPDNMPLRYMRRAILPLFCILSGWHVNKCTLTRSGIFGKSHLFLVLCFQSTSPTAAYGLRCSSHHFDGSPWHPRKTTKKPEADVASRTTMRMTAFPLWAGGRETFTSGCETPFNSIASDSLLRHRSCWQQGCSVCSSGRQS